MLKRLSLVLVIGAVVVASVWAVGNNHWDEAELQMLPTATADTIEVVVPLAYEEAVCVDGIKGTAIFNASPYDTAGAGLADSASITLSSRLVTPFSTTQIQIAALAATDVPCTLYFNTQDDSLFVGELFFDVAWYDTVAVAAGDTAFTTFNYSLQTSF